MPVVDASVIVSWLVQQDTNHRAALRWVVSSQAGGEVWNVPSIILPEVAAAIGRALGRPVLAQELVGDFSRLDEVLVHPVTERLGLSSAVYAAQLADRGAGITMHVGGQRALGELTEPLA